MTTMIELKKLKVVSGKSINTSEGTFEAIDVTQDIVTCKSATDHLIYVQYDEFIASLESGKELF